MGTKFIRNTDDASIVCRIPSDKNKVFNFKCKKFDKRNNVLLSNGYTEISEEDLVLLNAESKAFQAYSKTGELTVVDSLPHESMSSEQLIAALRNEIASLKKEQKNLSKGDDSSANLKEALETITDMTVEISALKKELEEAREGKNSSDLEKEIEELKEKVEAQERMIEALDTQLAESYQDLAEEVGKE